MSLKIKLNRKTYFYISFMFLMLLIYAKYVFEIDFSNIVFVLVSCVIAFWADENDLVAMSLCCIPMYTSFETYYAIAIFMVVYLLKYKIKIGLEIVPIIVLWLWEMIHCFNDGLLNNASLVFILPYLFCVIVMFNCANRVNYSYVVRIYAIDTLLMCGVVISRMIFENGFNFSLLFSNMKRLGMQDVDEVGVLFNPNTLGFFCILAIIGLLQLVVTKRSKKSDVLIIIFLAISGFLTMSITYIVCLIITICMFVFSYKGDWTKKLKLFIGMIGCLFFIYIFIFFVFPTVIEDFVSRFLADDISNGRIDLLLQYNEYIFSSIRTMFWGSGLSNYYSDLEKYFGISNIQVPHNALQEIIVVWGLVGFVLIMMFFVNIILKSKRTNSKQRLLNYIPLIMIFIKVQAGQLVTAYYTMMTLSFAYLSLCYDFSKNEES